MSKGSALVDTTLESPVSIQLEEHEAVSISTRHGSTAHRDRCHFPWINRLQLQGCAALLQSKSEAGSEILPTTPQRVTVAVEVSTADSGEIKTVESGLHKPVGSWRPAAWTPFDLFEDEQFPVTVAHWLCQYCKAGLVQWLAVKQSSCRQSPGNEHDGQTGCGQTSCGQTGCGQTDCSAVGSPHARLREKPCCTEQWQG